MLGAIPTLLTAEELRALFARAVAELRAVDDTDRSMTQISTRRGATASSRRSSTPVFEPPSRPSASAPSPPGWSATRRASP
jgi:hypothetical protein